ncbi:hypothetical protein J6Z19_01145 [bacterium]|nr:hypothetical protein [bacterium]
MLFHSANSVTYLGRTLRINFPSRFPKPEEILILTKKTNPSFSIKEKTRITTEEIAKSADLRKFLKFSEKTSIKVGSFEIKMAEVAPDKDKYNIFINDSAYFLTFLPEIFFPFREGSTLLLPADSEYFSESDFFKIEDFVAGTKPSKIVISGNYSEKLFSLLQDKRNAEIRNEISQENLFA